MLPTEALGWSLTPGRGSLSELSNDENQPEVGLETAGRFIHHIPELYPSLARLRWM
jgi:hypothetical protein